MSTTRWPAVVGWLLDTLPALPGWETTSVFDTDPVTSAVPVRYAIVGRTVDGATSGSYVRTVDVSLMVSESGLVLIHVVTRTGNTDPDQVRLDGFALVDAIAAAVAADQTLGGALGPLGTANLAVDVQSGANRNGVAQSLVVSLTYTSLTT